MSIQIALLQMLGVTLKSANFVESEINYLEYYSELNLKGNPNELGAVLKDGINASYDDPLYVSAHSKMVYTTPTRIYCSSKATRDAT
jgi:hypothetical protein